jgi:hypothetical protein
VVSEVKNTVRSKVAVGLQVKLRDYKEQWTSAMEVRVCLEGLYLIKRRMEPYIAQALASIWRLQKNNCLQDVQ